MKQKPLDMISVENFIYLHDLSRLRARTGRFVGDLGVNWGRPFSEWKFLPSICSCKNCYIPSKSGSTGFCSVLMQIHFPFKRIPIQWHLLVGDNEGRKRPGISAGPRAHRRKEVAHWRRKYKHIIKNQAGQSSQSKTLIPPLSQLLGQPGSTHGLNTAA